MTRQISVLFVVFPCLIGCGKGDGAPGAFEKFLPLAGGVREEMCADATDGKRYWLEGYLQLPRSFSIDKGKASLDFFARVDGNFRGAGRSMRVDVTTPGDIDDLWASAEGKKLAGFRREQAKIDNDALRIRVKDGSATARDKIKLTFDVNAVRNYLTKEITACLYPFVRAEKV